MLAAFGFSPLHGFYWLIGSKSPPPPHNFMKQTATQAIISALERSGKPLALHEMGILNHSQTALSARTREMARLGLIAGTVRRGTKYKEWSLATSSLPLANVKVEWIENQAVIGF